MEIKQVVSMGFSSVCTPYYGLNFCDPSGNEVCIKMSDDQLLEVAQCVENKAQRILKERVEESAKLLQETEG